MMNLAVFASYNGSGMDVIYNAIKRGELPLNLALVISNNTDANALKKAEVYNIKNKLINAKTSRNPDEEIYDTLKDNGIDIIFLSGYMKKISSKITSNFKVINTHPALLPKFGGAGMYGSFVHKAVIEAHEEISGVTIHRVNENYDEGEIILQESLTICENETAESLETKIKKLEKSTILHGLQRCLN